MSTQLKYSIVVPVYNEKDVVEDLHREIVRVMEDLTHNSNSQRKLGKPFFWKESSLAVGVKSEAQYEIIFVDDGSTDDTFEILRRLAPIKIVRFRKNFGQTAALDAGIKQARGEVIITLDGDGQNPPSEIPKLLKKLDEGYDVVCGWRWERKDPLIKRFISKGAAFLRGFLVKDQIHDSGCTLRAYRRECLKNIDLHGEMHRFLPAILKWQGYKIGEIKVEHRERKSGKTKYSWKRIPKGFIDMWSIWFWRKYADRPLHLFGGLGLLFGSCGSIVLIYLAIARFLQKITLSNRIWPLIAVFLILMGIQLFVAGLLADISIKTYYNKKRKYYSIKEIIEKK